MIFSFIKNLVLILWLWAFLFPGYLYAESFVRQASYYSDAFEWGRTANGDTFTQSAYSAALCDITLGQYLYVSKWSTGIVVEANDRPSCPRNGHIIDMSTEAFRQFAPLSVGRIDGVLVTPIGPSPTDRQKTFLDANTFEHLGVILMGKIPTILFSSNTLEVTGKVTTNDQYVLLYVLKEGAQPVNTLVKVGKDRFFKWYVTLPNVTGDAVFVVAGGNSFDTDKYATLSLISQSSLIYPKLTEKPRARINPKISYSSMSSPLIRLPQGIYGELEIRQGKRMYSISGKQLLLSNLPLTLGSAQVKIAWYGLSTDSPLDRSIRYPHLYSGSVLLERAHDTIGGDLIFIQQKINTAKFRFKTPSTYRIRGKYYVTSPKWEVSEKSFPRASLDTDGYLKGGIIMSGSVSFDKVGTSMLEIVREDGIAFVNIPITFGNAWPVIEPFSSEEITTIRTDKAAVVQSTIQRINTIRNGLWKYSLKEDEVLMRLAQAKVDDMIRRWYQGHMDPDGNFIDYLATKLAIDAGGSIGENIWYGTVSDLSLQDGLEESWVHRMNMLQDSWTRVGIGYGVNEGKTYLVHIFSE